MDEAEVLAALMVLAKLDHFDESRRAAAVLPLDLPLAAVLRAADGATALARALDTRRRVAEGAAARADSSRTATTYR